jgi:hypothetical protein
MSFISKNIFEQILIVENGQLSTTHLQKLPQRVPVETAPLAPLSQHTPIPTFVVFSPSLENFAVVP